jgi:hypothetical protein
MDYGYHSFVIKKEDVSEQVDYLQNTLLIPISDMVFTSIALRNNPYVVISYPNYLFQLLDNRNSLIEWSGGTSGIFSIEGDYIKIKHINPLVSKFASCKNETTLVSGTTYTVLYKITEKTTRVEANFALHTNGVTEATLLENSIGVHATLTVADSSSLGDVIFFSYDGLNEEYIIFRAVLVKGDLTGLSDAEIEDIVMNTEYGLFVI